MPIIPKIKNAAIKFGTTPINDNIIFLNKIKNIEKMPNITIPKVRICDLNKLCNKLLNKINTPASWPETYEKIEKYPLAKEIAAILGDTESNKAFISTLDNPKANIDERRNALKNLASKKTTPKKKTKKQKNQTIEEILENLIYD